MTIKKLAALAAAGAVALSCAGCSVQDTQQAEAQAYAILAAVKAGAAVAISTIKTGVDAVCENTGVITFGAGYAGQVLATQIGPNSTQNQQNVQTALMVIDKACAVAAADPTSPSLRTLFKQAMAAYAVVKAQQQ